jgi:polyribonucleotide nucleotidyltransferase
MKKTFETEIGKRKLKAEISDLAEQTDGSCFLRYGDSMVLSTVVVSKEEKENASFLPLTVEYEEKYYAAGKIKGPRFIKRETRPSDEAICNARMIDRTLRPLFPENFKREIQVINTVLSWDGENDPDIVGLMASSIALSISQIPWEGPVAAVRIGKIGKNFILNPTYEEKEISEMDFVISAVERDGKILFNMLEGGFSEIKEGDVLKVFDFARPFLEKLISFQKEIKKAVGKPKIEILKEKDLKLEEEIRRIFSKEIQEALEPKEKIERTEFLEKLTERVREFLEQKFPEKIGEGFEIFKKEYKKALQKNILEKDLRPDGRKPEEIREIYCEAGLLPRTHGSALFCRGLTKSLSILTLGAPGDVQLLEGMEITGKKRFMHHYNFPPYCAGEVRPLRGPGRREIGHGMLVEKALLPVIPSFDDFPYTIRVVSEILSSNGSTSMAACCSSSLALMDAGVPIKNPVAGIALGLVNNEKGNYKILTDIQGPEDFFGNMDFKVAGTEKGICAIQMDLKIDGIPKEIIKESLERAKKARLFILRKIKEVLASPRKTLSPFAPKILTIQISPEKIREVIGPGGRVINEIISECGVSIDIEETGRIFVTAEKEEAAKKAISWIKNITREIKVGEVFQGKVKRVLSFGILIELVPGQEGLLHMSKVKPLLKRGKKIKVGDLIPVKVVSIDEIGRINLGLVDFKRKHGR